MCPRAMNMWFKIMITLWALSVVRAERGTETGCFVFNATSVLNTHAGQSVDVCLSACEQLYYRFTLISNGSTCFCGNSPGAPQVTPDMCSTFCPKNATQRCGGERVASVYDTGVTTPGPPSDLKLVNFTETTARIHWGPPDAYTTITDYIIRARVLESPSETLLKLLTWSVSNNTLHFELLSLHPGTKYNITVSANSYEEEGPQSEVIVETEIGTPDPSPAEVEIVRRHGTEMHIRIPPATNENGPVSRYRIIVSIELNQQGYIPENLKDYNAAKAEGLPYYITAEINASDTMKDFTIGDGMNYGAYYNAPLPLINDIDISVGVISEKNGIQKIRYADASKKVILNVNEPEEVSGLVVALGAAIAIGVVLLLIGIGLLIILKKKIQLVRAQRCSQSMPLSLSEPCIEIENSGFLPEDDERVDHYSNLKRRLWNIPRNLIDIDISCLAGMGNYGKFTRGKVQQHGGHTPSLIQIIADRELERLDRKSMLQELDLLIKTSEHPNVISLVGICETPTSLFVVLHDTRETLKELLISCRHRDFQNNKFSLITEPRVVQICVDIVRGMEYLHTKKIMHKRLCCRNVAMADGGIPKVSGFGLSHIHPLNETPDYTRWSSLEYLQQCRYNPKSDVWMFGCLLWEALTLGATPYSQTSSVDVAARVLRGLRPAQPSYVGDELFQLCLQCWQVDPDERPNFTALLRELDGFASATVTGILSFTHYNDFSYEPYVPRLEVTL